MKKLLIIGASILQLPAIKKAKELGHYVAVADFNPNAVGIPYADEFYNASTIDIDAICNVAKEFKPDGIMRFKILDIGLIVSSLMFLASSI